MAKHHVLIDACVAAAHFAPKSTHSVNLRTRSTTLLSGSAPDIEIQFLIPDFCIAEVFAVFEKYRWGRTWNRQVKTRNCLSPTEFKEARDTFRAAIHNGASILQYQLIRYHVLSVDLIAPINNAYQIQRRRGPKANSKNPRPASTFDMLIVSMGVWLQRQFGPDSFTVVTGDDRIRQVVDRAKSAKLGRPMRAHLTGIAADLGLTYSPSLYPTILNLTNCPPRSLKGRFPDWSPSW